MGCESQNKKLSALLWFRIPQRDLHIKGVFVNGLLKQYKLTFLNLKFVQMLIENY